jgi:GT2 family glycosyltransferase
MDVGKNEFVVALIATYRRFDELKRCLDCLVAQTRSLSAVVVVDNAAEDDIKALVESRGVRFCYLPLPGNQGCGAALKTGEEYSFKEWGAQVSHFWVMDDDAAPTPATLEQLLDADAQTAAAIVAPICVTSEGKLFGLPDTVKLVPRKIRKTFRSPREVRDYFGARLAPIRWCVGVSFLVKSRAVRESGLHRADFWMHGEDLEFSMRLCLSHGGVLDTLTIIPHLYPPGTHDGSMSATHFAKFCFHLQNMAYLVSHEIRNWFNWYCLGAAYRRFFVTFGWRWLTVRYALITFWNGVVLAKTVGRLGGKKLRLMISREVLRGKLQ